MSVGREVSILDTVEHHGTGEASFDSEELSCRHAKALGSPGSSEARIQHFAGHNGFFVVGKATPDLFSVTDHSKKSLGSVALDLDGGEFHLREDVSRIKLQADCRQQSLCSPPAAEKNILPIQSRSTRSAVLALHDHRLDQFLGLVGSSSWLVDVDLRVSDDSKWIQ